MYYEEPRWFRFEDAAFDLQFNRYMRFNREQFQTILSKLGNIDGQDNKFRQGVKTDERLALCLAILGDDQTFLKGAGNWQRGKTTGWESMYLVMKSLIQNCSDAISFPRGNYALQCCLKFKERSGGIPNVVACVDGSHVRIQRPEEHQEIYYDRNGNHSINVQFMFDPYLMVADVFTGCPGSWHDARMFTRSELYRQYLAGTILDGPVKYFNGRSIPQLIVGDVGYPNLNKHVTPYKK